MKKILILSMMAIASLSSCKKDKKNTPAPAIITDPITSILWHTTAKEVKYYDENNTLLYKEKDTSEINYAFSNNIATVTDKQNNVTTGSYIITESEGKKSMSITINGVTETYVLTSVTDKLMTWTQEKTNTTYIKNGVSYAAAKQVTTIKFSCPCQE